MKIAYNPLGSGAHTPAPDNKDIIFDLVTRTIYAKGVPFNGTKYIAFKKHTSPDNTGGSEGLVPIPSYSTTNTRLLREDGLWVNVAEAETPDDYLSTESTNSVENRVIAEEFEKVFALLILKAENVYKIINVGGINLVASGTNDVLEFVQGNGILLLPSEINKSITISTRAIGLLGIDISYNSGQLIAKVADTYFNRWNEVFNWYTSVTEEDTDDYINKWQEIVDFLNGVPDTTLNGILANFVKDLETTGEGNAVTDVSKIGNKITVTKGNSFLPLSGGTVNGWVNIRNTKNAEGTLLINTGSSSSKPRIRFEGDMSWGYLGFASANKPCYYDNSLNEYILWHSGNDGAGSGLDADLLDGQHASYFATAASLGNYVTLNTAQTITGLKLFTQAVITKGRVVITGGLALEWLDIEDRNETSCLLLPRESSGYRLNYYDGTNWHWLAYSSDVDALKDYYWANVKISKDSSTTTSPTFANATMSGILTFTTARNTAKIKFLNGEIIDGYGNVHLGTNSASWNIYDGSDNYLLTLLKNGNLGIGTTSPTYKLQVVGNVAATSLIGGYSGTRSFWAGGGGTYAWIDSRDTSNNVINNIILYDDRTATRTLTPHSNNTYSLGISSLRWSNVYGVLGNFTAGLAGIITLRRTSDSGGAFIDYYNNNQTTNFWRVGMTSNGDFGFAWKGVMTNTCIKNNGYVGVLTTTVSYPLSVNGKIYTSSEIIVGDDGGDVTARVLKSYRRTSPYINIGYAASAGDCGEFYYGYSASASANNFVSMGLYSGNRLKLYYNGGSGVGKVTIASALKGGTEYELLHTGNFAYTWNATTTKNAWSRIMNMSSNSNVILTINFSQYSLASSHTYFVNTNHGTARVMLVMMGGYSNNSTPQVRVTKSSELKFHVEVYNTYGYNGATTLIFACKAILAYGSMSTISTYTAGSGTVCSSLTSSNTIASNFNSDLLDGVHANGLLTGLSSSTTNKVSITVGGTTKNITTLYASYLCSVGVVNPLTGRTLAYGNVYSYGTQSSAHEGAPTIYTSVIGFGRGTAGSVEICGEWTSGRGLWARALRDVDDDWYAWDRILTEATYKTVLDSRYLPTNYYWANVKITSSSNTGAIPTFGGVFINTGDATLKMYSGYITNSKSDGNVCLLTSIDGTDGLSHTYPTQHESRCNLVLQPRGGQVYIGTNPDGGNTNYKLYVNGNIYGSYFANSVESLRNHGTLTAVSGTTTMSSGLRLYSVYNNGYPCTYGNVLRIGGNGSGELVCGWTGDSSLGRLYYRSKRDVASLAWSGWGTIAYTSDIPNMGLTTITKSIRVTTSWLNTGITGANIGDGSFVVQITNISDFNNGGKHYSETYTGLMTSTTEPTNSTESDEILLHRAGHAPNSSVLYLRTIRTSSSGYLLLLIAGNYNMSAALDITFKFRRII